MNCCHQSSVRGDLPYPFSTGYSKLIDDLHRARLYREQHDFASARSGTTRRVQLFVTLVGNSQPLQQVRQMMQQVADSDVTVLITGESGTGKEVVARNLHVHSSRRDKPFVPSTVAQSLANFWKASCSVTKKAHLQVRLVPEPGGSS